MKALLLCASHNDLYLIRALKKLGYFIIATGSVKGQPGEPFVDKYIQVDYSDKAEILRIAQEENIDAIVQCCNDYGVYTATYVAEKLGLPGYDSYEKMLILHDKDRFKKFCMDNGILAIPSHFFSNATEAEKWSREAKYPLIVKPVDCSAGIGIQKVENYQEACEAVHLAFEKSRAGRILIERFITGSQHGFSTFLKEKKVIAHCSNNEYSFENPYRVEIDTYPSDNEELYSKLLISQVEKIAEILDLSDGMFHLQYMVEDGNVYIIEVMRRIAGNMYGVPAQMLTHFDWDYWETRARCGLSLEQIPMNTYVEGYYAYKTILAQKEGIIKDIKIPEKYRKYIWDKYFVMHVGDEITRHLQQPVGFLFMMFPDADIMRKILIDEYESDMVIMEETKG